MKYLFVLLVFAGLALGQDQVAAARAAAGCGPEQVWFNVKTDKQHHPVAQPEPGKAIVYLFSDTSLDNYPGPFGHLLTRVGIDGVWLGANDRKSYFFFTVDPGEHRLCTSRQSSSEGQREAGYAALSFTAEAGKARTTSEPCLHRHSSDTRPWNFAQSTPLRRS